MIKKDRSFAQYNSGDLVYIISPLTNHLHTASRKFMIKYVGPVVIYYRSSHLSINDTRWKNTKRTMKD